jgi:hypothetical protein
MIATILGSLITGFTIGLFATAFRDDIQAWWAMRQDRVSFIDAKDGWQVWTYAKGTVHEYTHATPTSDGEHLEDDQGDCYCNPTCRDYESSEGWPAKFFAHRVMAGDEERRAR